MNNARTFSPSHDRQGVLSSTTEDFAASVLRRDRAILICAGVAISALAWAYMLRPAAHVHSGGAAEFAAASAMWTLMMVAMMLPSVSPYVLAFAAVHRQRRNENGPYVPAGIFLGGYFFIWTAFSVIAAAAQVALQRAALLSPMLNASSAVFAGGLLMAAGIYQWTPLKNSCLRHCRSPLGFLLGEWRTGARGAFRMGVEHGIFCLGCCWLLMALPFAAGVMNLLWMAALTVFILIEKAVPGGQWMGRIAGFALAVWGGWMITAAIR